VYKKGQIGELPPLDHRKHACEIQKGKQARINHDLIFSFFPIYFHYYLVDYEVSGFKGEYFKFFNRPGGQVL